MNILIREEKRKIKNKNPVDVVEGTNILKYFVIYILVSGEGVEEGGTVVDW